MVASPHQQEQQKLISIPAIFRKEEKEPSTIYEPGTKYTYLQWFLFAANSLLMVTFIVLATTPPGLHKFIPVTQTYLKFYQPSSWVMAGIEGVVYPNTQHYSNIKILYFGVVIFGLGAVISLINLFLSGGIKCCRGDIDGSNFRTNTFVGRAIIQALVYPLIGYQVGIFDVQFSILLATVAFAKITLYRKVIWEGFFLSLTMGVALWTVLIWSWVNTRIEFILNGYADAIFFLCFVYWIAFVAMNVCELMRAGRNLTKWLIGYEILFFITVVSVSFLAWYEISYHPARLLTPNCQPGPAP